MTVSISHVETTTQVIVHAYTELTFNDFTTRVGARTARIKKATIVWNYEDGAWRLGSVDIWGPVIRQSDGAESSQHVSELTRPAFASNAQYGVITPQEIVDVALQHVPDWEPGINETHYPRSANLRSSL